MERKINYKSLFIAFILYTIIVLWVIVFKFNASWIPVNSAYLRTLPISERIMSHYPFQVFVENGLYFELDYFMNIVIYVPLAVYLCFLLRTKYKYIIIIFLSLFSSIIFEIIQLITGFGGFDATDILCNTLGGIVGIFLFIPLYKLKDKVINIINYICICVLLPVSLFAVINTIINYQLYVY